MRRALVPSSPQLQPAPDGLEQLVVSQIVDHAGLPDVVEQYEVADTADPFLVPGSSIEAGFEL